MRVALVFFCVCVYYYVHIACFNACGYNWASFGLVFVTDWAEKK